MVVTVFARLLKQIFLVIGDSVPESCAPYITSAFNEGKFDADADSMYPQMKAITGVEPRNAKYEDFQREFKCQNLQFNDCNANGLGFPPQGCSFPPCNECTVSNPGNL